MRYIKLVIVAILCFGTISSMAQIHMTGRVTNENEEPLVGALVTLKGTDIKVLTNSEGRYEIVVPEEYAGNSMVASFFGYPSDSTRVKRYHDFTLFSNKLEVINNIALVSTQKREQTNIAVPITISLIEKSKIEKLNLNEPQELCLYTPGYYNQTQSCVYSVNVIRGVASDGSNSYSFFQPRISVFLDGVSTTHMGTASTDFFDMQRVEVVKGPQGTLFGKGAEFGAINYVTKKPVEDFESMLYTGYGSFNQKILKGMVNTPINPNTQNRLSFYLNGRDGYNTNVADNSTLSGKGAVSVRNILKHKPTENINLIFSVDYEHNSEPSVSYKGNALAPLHGGYDVSPFSPAEFDEPNLFAKRDMGGFNYSIDHQFSDDISYSSTTALRAYRTAEHYDLDGTFLPIIGADEKQNGLQISQEVRLSWTNHEKIDAFAGISYMYDRNKHSMHLHTNLQRSFSYLVRGTLMKLMESLAGQLALGINQGVSQEMSGYKKMLPPEMMHLLEELVASMTNGMGARIRANVMEKYEEVLARELWETTPDIYTETIDVIRSTIASAISNQMQNMAMQNPEMLKLADYVSVDKILDGLNLDKQLGVLKQYSSLELDPGYQENETDINVYHESSLFADASYKILDNLTFTLGLRGTLEHQKTSYFSTSNEAPLVGSFIYHTTNGETVWLHDTELSWVGRAVINYMPTPNNNIYLSVSKGRRPGTIYYNFRRDHAVKLRPEIAWNYELGIKGSFLKNHILYSLAGYYYNWTHFQNQEIVEYENGIRSYENSDNGKARAMGFESSLEAYFGFLNMFVDYSFIDTKFLELGNDKLDLSKSKFRMTPKHSFDAGLDLRIPLQRTLGLYFRPTYSWMSEMYFNSGVVDENSYRQKAFGLGDLNVGFNFTIKRISYDIGLFARNIADKDYLLDAGCTGQMVGFPTFIMGPPRTIGVGLRLDFK